MVTMLVHLEVTDYPDVISHASHLELLVEQISAAETSSPVSQALQTALLHLKRDRANSLTVIGNAGRLMRRD